MLKPDHIILEGITGSTAHGMATEDSDEDVKGIYVLPTAELLRLGHVPDRDSVVNVSPDFTYHELGKFMLLAAKGNPDLIELLFLGNYTYGAHEGAMLLANRELFLTQRIRGSYMGYAMDQMQRLQKRADGSFKSKLRKRYSKHARHCFRLMWSGRELLETGDLTVRMTPEQREELFAIGELPPEELAARFKAEDDKLRHIKSDLPLEPDWDKINDLLLELRKPHK